MLDRCWVGSSERVVRAACAACRDQRMSPTSHCCRLPGPTRAGGLEVLKVSLRRWQEEGRGGAGVLVWRLVRWLKAQLAGDKEEPGDEPDPEHQFDTARARLRLREPCGRSGLCGAGADRLQLLFRSRRTRADAVRTASCGSAPSIRRSACVVWVCRGARESRSLPIRRPTSWPVSSAANTPGWSRFHCR